MLFLTDEYFFTEKQPDAQASFKQEPSETLQDTISITPETYDGSCKAFKQRNDAPRHQLVCRAVRGLHT